MPTAIEFNHVSKQYRLGLVSTRTISHDLNRWWQTAILHHEDPYLKIGETNDRATRGNSEYVWALRDIDFKVEQGDVVGIIGKNGAGKSTLLKLLSRVTTPTTGSIRARGRIASLLEVGTGFHQELTGRENIYMNGTIMGMSKAEVKRKLDEIVDFSGCERYLDTPVKRYSSGMTVRLGFAVAAHLDPEILVVDEVLAVGDAEFQKKAIGKMQDVSRGEGRTVLFVSHNMASIRALCKTGVLLENGMVKYTGEVNDVVDHYIGNAVQLGGEKIIDSFKIKDDRLRIDQVKINGQETNRLELQWPNRTIDIEISGYYDGIVPLDLELAFFSDNEILIAKHTPSLFTGEVVKVDHDKFTLHQKLELPLNLTNATYYLRIDVTHPKISYLAQAENAVQLILDGNYTAQGIPVDKKYFGVMCLK
ncbi:MAG: ABC transporter ATP-binding protein [Bacteroidales bacterium]|nr:ABC transporter ATP-binding protein [Bacteroidales bacterium]